MLVGVIGLARGENFRLMFLSAVSLAVAAIPEGFTGYCHHRTGLGCTEDDQTVRDYPASPRGRNF